MTNKAKPLDLQTDIEKAANSFEAYLDSENEPPEEAHLSSNWVWGNGEITKKNTMTS